MSKVVTRFAPSPTGDPHVGNIRTAIFAYLCARSQKGKFLLRIEDTDRERMVPGSLENIEASLKWLGLDYDDEKVFQSERREYHLKMAEKLLSEGKAYKCFCSKERLDTLRETQQKEKKAPGYDGRCRHLTKEVINEKEKAGECYVIRFAMPETGTAEWDDQVRGKMAIEYSASDDQVIVKSDGWPTYHLASVIDDHDSGVTDVIRGEEWIPSTPKHIAIYKAFGWEVPRFAHTPQINGTGGKKLSKRDGDTAILDYREKGYLPEAMLNFLSLLGWNEGTEKEIYTKKELIAAFTLKRIGRSPAVFDQRKLDWINGHYLREKDNEDLVELLKELYPKEGIVKSDKLSKIIEVEKSRLSKLSDLLTGTEYFLGEPKYDPNILIFKNSNKEDTKKGLEGALTALGDKTWDKLSVNDFENVLKDVVEKSGLSNGDVFWPVRVALSGLEKSPSPAEIMWVLGKEETLLRLKTALKSLS